MKIYKKIKVLFFSLIFGGLFACVDLEVTDTANVAGDAEYELASLTIILDDSSFFLAAAGDLSAVKGRFSGCDSGNAESGFDLDDQGDGTYDFYVGQGDDNCFLALDAVTINDVEFLTGASTASDDTLWQVNDLVTASNEDGTAEVEISVLDNINDDGPYGFSTDADDAIDASFELRTEIEGSSVSAILRESATLSADGHSVPQFSITAEDGSGDSDFGIQDVGANADGALAFVLNLRLHCPAAMVVGATNGDGSDDYHYTCDGLDINATKTDVTDTDATEGSIVWDFLLIHQSNSLVNSGAFDISMLDTLSSTASLNTGGGNDWVHLNEAPTGISIGYQSIANDGTNADGCSDTAAVNYQACIYPPAGADNGGFALALESDFADSEIVSPDFYLVVAAIEMEEDGANAVTKANQRRAYFILDIGIQITDVND